MKPEWIVLESSLAGTGLEEPGQLRLPSIVMQQIAVDSCTHVDGSLQLGVSCLPSSRYQDENRETKSER